MPLFASPGLATTDLIGKNLTELQAPLADRLVGQEHPARSHQLLDVPEAEGEAKLQPDRVADDLGREPMTGIVSMTGIHPPILPNRGAILNS